jgi:stage V sporulation protein AF
MMNWLEVTVSIKPKWQDIVSQIFIELGIQGIEIVDPEDFRKILQEAKYSDYAEDDFLCDLGKNIIIRAYFSADNDSHSLRKKLNEAFERYSLTPLPHIDIGALVMAEKTLEELIVKKRWYNPLPQVKFTERPDVVAAHLMEGHIAIIVDTSPSVMILPATLFHFTQHAEDYYQNITVGTYIRWIRFLGMLSAFILLPLWLLLVFNKQYLPEFLQFLGPRESTPIPLFIQFILLEFGLDLLRISSIHTPNALTTSLGIIGGLILSEFAVDVGLFVPETVLYMALAGIGTFATPSMEFSMAIRIFRLLLLILTGLFNIYGFITAIIIVFVITYSTGSFKYGKKYTWPLIPFEWKPLSNILFRKPIPELKGEGKQVR